MAEKGRNRRVACAKGKMKKRLFFFLVVLFFSSLVLGGFDEGETLKLKATRDRQRRMTRRDTRVQINQIYRLKYKALARPFAHLVAPLSRLFACFALSLIHSLPSSWDSEFLDVSISCCFVPQCAEKNLGRKLIKMKRRLSQNRFSSTSFDTFPAGWRLRGLAGGGQELCWAALVRMHS